LFTKSLALKSVTLLLPKSTNLSKEIKMHGNSKTAMLMRVIDLRKWLADTPDENIAMVEYYQAEIEKLMKRIYR
jgi:hypothetical protein